MVLRPDKNPTFMAKKGSECAQGEKRIIGGIDSEF
jgi:hypothetical protein